LIEETGFNVVEQVIKIELLGETFKFKSDQNRKNLKEILSYMIEELRKVEEQFPAHAMQTNKLAILVMTALNISKQYVELTNNHSELLESVSLRASKLDDMIDSK
jgi:cell division protein ZapA (FtsZ GTPase activity inhibitor)